MTNPPANLDFALDLDCVAYAALLASGEYPYGAQNGANLRVFSSHC